MAKKTQKKCISDNENAVKFKWEFLRRNKFYKTALENHLKNQQALLDILNRNAKGLQIRPEDLQAIVTDQWSFSRKWGLSMCGGEFLAPYPRPAKEFNELSEWLKLRIHERSTDISLETVRWLLDCRESELNKEPSQRKLFNKDCGLDIGISELALRIDLTKPEQQILLELSQIIKLLKNFRKSLHKEKNIRRRLEDYEFYLKVYDLREKGLSWIQIYKELHPNSSHQIMTYGKDFMLQKVKRAYVRCKELIEEGYKDIC